MDLLASIHPLPSSWLCNSDFAPFIPAYCRELVGQRYADETVRQYLYGVAHFAHWAREHRLAVGDLANNHIQRFLDQHLPRCICPRPVHKSRHQLRAALRHLVVSLKHAGVLIECHAPDAVQDELHRFDTHMRDSRGLAVRTRIQRLQILRPFLEQTCRSHPGEPTLPVAEDLRQFIKHKLLLWSPASAHVLASTLRSYLRFRAVDGEPVEHLLPVIASPANWRLAPLPQTLSPTEVTRLFASFSPELPSALRAYAMVRCAVDLGLRAGEVVSLGLDDIDWVAGTLRIGQSKARRVDLLPLPHATGSAIAKYLRSERPSTNNRRVFVRHRAPADVPIGKGVVQNAIREAYQRCGIPHTRVHVLRHTLASRLLEAGGTLKDVADLLRHRELDTSLIYAKVDASRLSAVALPWPGSEA
jgi:integrase